LSVLESVAENPYVTGNQRADARRHLRKLREKIGLVGEDDAASDGDVD
jgi:hypothetical protein